MTRPTINPLETRREGERHRVALAPLDGALRPPPALSALRPTVGPLDPTTRDGLEKLRASYALASIGAAAGVSEPTVRRALSGAPLLPHVRRALGALVDTAARAA